MPTLPLFTAPPSPNASHQVRSPGGYEFWSFRAHDPATDTHFTATFLDGSPFVPSYLREYRSFLRWPTLRRPPTRSDYPRVQFSLQRAGHIVHDALIDLPTDSFESSSLKPNLTAGANRMKQNAAGDYEIHLEDPRFTADLTFRPSEISNLKCEIFPSRALTGADHHWLPAAPRCEVSGTVRVADATSNFHGRGVHDHHYGTGPLHLDIKRWNRGHILTEDRTLLFQIAEPMNASSVTESVLLEASASGVHALTDVHFSAHGTEELHFGQQIKLVTPHIVQHSPAHLTARYTAQFKDGSTAIAWCEVNSR